MQAEEENNHNNQVQQEYQQQSEQQAQQSIVSNPNKLILSEEKKQIIIRNQIFVFTLTFLAYAAIHSTRTAWSSSKQSLKEDLDEKDDHYLGLVDTCFLLCYAFSMKFLGGYSSRFQIQYFLGFGMISASVCLLVIYFICQVSINKGFILFMMMLNGISQSTGWPSVVACMGNWFGSGKKGLLMGIWGTNGNVGNMIGYFVQDLAVNTLDLNWKFVLFIIGIFLLIIGSIIIFNLEPYPNKLGITQADLDTFQQIQSQMSNSGFGQKQHKGDHVELEEDLEADEKRNQTVVFEMPNKYQSFEDDDYHQQGNQNERDNDDEKKAGHNGYTINLHKENNHENNQNGNNDNHNNEQADEEKIQEDNLQNNNLNIQITETNSKETIISQNQSPLVKEKSEKEKKKDDEITSSSKNNHNINNDDSDIISENNSNYKNNDNLKINANNEFDNSSNGPQKQIDIESNEVKDQNTQSHIVIQNDKIEQDQINVFNAWVKVPGLTIYAFTQGGAKGTIYGLMFWLPIYLQEHGLKNQAAFICSMNEIGTFCGGLLLGMLIDKFKMKATTITLFLILSSIVMFIIHFLPSGVAAPYYIFVLLGGICLGGPYTMLGGAVAIDLAQQPEVRHYKNITALLAGIIEGFGSFVAAFVQIVIPFFGQKYIFLLFTVSSLLSSGFLMKKALAEIRASPYYEYFQKK